MATPQLPVILQIAKEILTDNNNKAMHVSDIVTRAMELNKNMSMSAEDFKRKLNGALAANLDTKTPTFMKVKNTKTGTYRKGIYKLKRSATQPRIQIHSVKPPAVPTLYSGKSGEYSVAAELLFWGYNVSKVAVDDGIDLVAETASGKFEHIQVKTAIAKKDTKVFNFKIDDQSFKQTASKKPWYVFVCREDFGATFAVIPFDLINMYRQQGVITGKDLSIQITPSQDGKEYFLCGTNITMFIDRFDQLDNMFS